MTGPDGREALDYDGEVFYLSLTPDSAHVEGIVEGYLERTGEDDPEGVDLLRGEGEEGDKEMALEILKAECEVRTDRPKRLG